jgi:hypothetical protein
MARLRTLSKGAAGCGSADREDGGDATPTATPHEPLCFAGAFAGMEPAALAAPKTGYSTRAAVQLRRYLRGHVGTPNTDAVEVVIVLRVVRRRFVNEAELVEALHERVKAGPNPAAKVTLARLENMTLDEQLRTVSRARVLIGAQGAALAYCLVQAPGTAVVEINFPQHSDAATPGLNANVMTSFGTIAAAGSVEHVTYRIPFNNTVLPPGFRGWGDADLRVPVGGFKSTVDCALCVGFAPVDKPAAERRAMCGGVCDASKWKS